MKTLNPYVLALGIALFAAGVRAADPPKNPRLAATMKAIAADVGAVSDPAKKPIAQVTDDMVLAGMVRARSASYLLQLVDERKGSVVDGQFVPGELTPDPILNQAAPKAQELLDALSRFVVAARAALATADIQLSTEYSKLAKDRDFSALKRTVAELARIIGDAHKLFKPKPPTS